MYCSNCGNKIQENNALFCSSCGTKIGEIQVIKVIQEAGENSSTHPINPGAVYVVLGWVFFALSLFVLPVLFGGGGYLTYKVRSEVHGVILMVFATVGAILGVKG